MWYYAVISHSENILQTLQSGKRKTERFKASTQAPLCSTAKGADEPQRLLQNFKSSSTLLMHLWYDCTGICNVQSRPPSFLESPTTIFYVVDDAGRFKKVVISKCCDKCLDHAGHQASNHILQHLMKLGYKILSSLVPRRCLPCHGRGQTAYRHEANDIKLHKRD